MTPENRRKTFTTNQMIDCLPQDPKKALDQNDTSRWEKKKKISSKSICDKSKIQCLPL